MGSTNGGGRGPVAVLGIDIGGSAVKAGRIDSSGKELDAHRRGRSGVESFDALVDSIGELAREMGPFELVGVGVPGLLDEAAGAIEKSPNLPWIDGRPLRRAIAERLGLSEDRVHVENDANAAALGESWLGAGRDRADLFVVTLGTGIGGGIVLGDRLWRGRGMAGEIGHTKVHDTGPVCGCGRVGCLETFASATAARRRAEEAGLPRHAPGDVEALTAAAERGPGAERDLLEAIGVDLGRGVGIAVDLLDIRTFVFGGGFSAALELMEPGVRRGIDQASYGGRVEEIELRRAVLDNAAGWIGAARAAMLERT
ncbi:MAG: ROK family protein [Planctomycetota bacterium]